MQFILMTRLALLYGLEQNPKILLLIKKYDVCLFNKSKLGDEDSV